MIEFGPMNGAEVRKYTRIILPLLGLITIASACSTGQTTADEVRSGLPKPGIKPAAPLIYTNHDSAEFLVAWENLYKGRPEISIDSAGASFEWVREQYFNPFSEKNKLAVRNLPTPNVVYQVRLQGENCSTFKTELVCTDKVNETVNIVYDILPPTAEVSGFESRGGKLLIKANITDNLSGVKASEVQVIIDNPGFGSNSKAIKICDNAQNCTDVRLKGDYDPFNQVMTVLPPKYDRRTGKIMVQGTINDVNDNIDIAKTKATAEQSVLPPMVFDLDKVKIKCDDPAFNGFDFKLTCTPKASDGRSTVTVTVMDKLGNKYSQEYEVEIPPLSRRKSDIFHSLLALAFLTDTALLRKVKGDRVRRERRMVLVEAVKNRNPVNVATAFDHLTKKDRKLFPDTVEEYNYLTSIDQLVREKKYAEALSRLKKTFKRKNPLLTIERDRLLNTIVIGITRAVSGSDWRMLQDGNVRNLLDFIASTRSNYQDYGFLWERINEKESVRDSITSTVIFYLVSMRKMGTKELRTFGLLDGQNLKKQMTALVQWGDFNSLGVFLDGLVNRGDAEKPRGRISQSTYQEVKTIVDSAEEVVRRSLEGKITQVEGTNDTVAATKILEEIKHTLSRYRLHSRHSDHIQAGIAYQERRMGVFRLIGEREEKLLTLARELSLPEKGIFMTRFKEDVINGLKRREFMAVFIKRSDEEVATFIDGYIALNIMPLTYLVGAGYSFVRDVFTPHDIAKPDRFVVAPYHVEGKLAMQYRDELFGLFLNEIYTKLSSEYKDAEKRYRVAYDKWISISDGATYGKPEVAFVNMFLREIGLSNFGLSHESLARWYINKLKLVGK